MLPLCISVFAHQSYTSPLDSLVQCLDTLTPLLVQGCFVGGKKSAVKVTKQSTKDATSLEAKFKDKQLTCDTTDEGELEAILDEPRY